MRTWLLGAVALVASCAVGKTNPADERDAGAVSDAGFPSDAAADSDAGPADAGIPDAGVPYTGPTSCLDDPPPGAPEPPALPVYAGTCPVFVNGTNTLHSSGVDRTFIL